MSLSVCCCLGAQEESQAEEAHAKEVFNTGDGQHDTQHVLLFLNTGEGGPGRGGGARQEEAQGGHLRVGAAQQAEATVVSAGPCLFPSSSILERFLFKSSCSKVWKRIFFC
jgi:hypothetical protein